MQLTTALLADGAHVAGNKLYILGGQWDRLLVSAFPAQHPSMALVLVIRVEYSEGLDNHRLGIELTLEGKPLDQVKAVGQLATGHSPGQKRGDPSFVPIAIPFFNLTFEAPGRYEWVISVDDEPLGRVPLDVAQAQMPVMPAPPAPAS